MAAVGPRSLKIRTNLKTNQGRWFSATGFLLFMLLRQPSAVRHETHDHLCAQLPKQAYDFVKNYAWSDLRSGPLYGQPALPARDFVKNYVFREERFLPLFEQ